MITSYFSPKTEKNANRKRTSPNSVTTNETVTTKRRKETEMSNVTPTPSTTKSLVLSSEATELLQHLQDRGEGSWYRALEGHWKGQSFANLARFVANERRSGKTIYPPPADTFACLNRTPLHQVRVVLVGQDPYHGPGQGHGLCFSVRRGVALPPSLRNMLAELDLPSTSSSSSQPKAKPTHGCLERWADQGVLLLNTVLTVERGKAHSHAGKGWEQFTDEVLRVLCRHNQRLVFLLFGRPASALADRVVPPHNKHFIQIRTSHPSPLGARKTNAPFVGSRCFHRANEALLKMGLGPAIDWRLDGKLPTIPGEAGETRKETPVKSDNNNSEEISDPKSIGVSTDKQSELLEV